MKKTKLLIRFGILLLVGLIIYFFNYFAQQPDYGVINNQAASRQVPGLDWQSRLVSTNYLTYRLPKFLEASPNSPIYPPVIAQNQYAYNFYGYWLVTISVLNIPGGNLMANNAYQLRFKNPNNYQPSETLINKKTVYIFNQLIPNNQFSKLAIEVNGNYQVMVALSSNNTNQLNDLNSLFQNIIDSLQWQLK